MHSIIAIGIFQAIIAAAMLWKGSRKNSADGLLIMFIVCIACHLAIKFVIFNFVNDLQVRQQMNTFIGFCYGPLLYLYARKVADERFIAATRWYVFLPFVAAAIAYFAIAGIIVFSSASGYVLLRWYNAGSYMGISVSDITYALMALRINARYIGPRQTKERRIIRVIAWCFLGMISVSAPMYLANTFLGADLMIPVRMITYAALSGLCVMIIYYKYVAGYGADEPEVRMPVETGTPRPGRPEREVTADAGLTRKTAMADDKQKEIWTSLEAQMKQKLLFTDCDLNLDKLASLTGINKYHLSETLNNFAGKSFYQYINEYRIAYALKQMEDVPVTQQGDFNFLALAYKSGFKAKSSFNRYFKEITGFTPSEHLKAIRQPGIAL